VNLEGKARTNNQRKGWNDKLSEIIGHKHPTILQSITAFQADCFTVTTATCSWESIKKENQQGKVEISRKIV